MNKVPSWPSAWSMASTPTLAMRTVVSLPGTSADAPSTYGRSSQQRARLGDPTPLPKQLVYVPAIDSPQPDDPDQKKEGQQEAANDHDDDQRNFRPLGGPEGSKGLTTERTGVDGPRRGWRCSHGPFHLFAENGPRAHIPLVGESEDEPKGD